MEEIWKSISACRSLQNNVSGLTKLLTELENSTFIVNNYEPHLKNTNTYGYRISKNSDECWIDVFFNQNKDTQIEVAFVVNMFGLEYRYRKNLECDVYDFLSQVLSQFDEWKAEYQSFSERMEKSDKLNDISKNSVTVWLREMLKNSSYIYYIDEAENKSTLHIQLKKGMQLDIPIYYKSFQKIMPDLPDTIQKYEDFVNNCGIKVLISNSNPKQEWNIN
ncbi:MAG: hypothetical protein LBC47_02780 [Tannerella sp.]|jgi:hypothetical protein|nr:hypothetical protein [Tannerella sp.]